MTAPLVAFLEQLLDVARAGAAPSPPPPSEPEYLSVAEAAQRIGVTEKTIRAMLAEGMPHRRPRPRVVRIPWAEADAWMRERAEEQTKAPGADEAEARRRARLDAHRGEVH